MSVSKEILTASTDTTHVSHMYPFASENCTCLKCYLCWPKTLWETGLMGTNHSTGHKCMESADHDRQLQRCTADASKHYSASQGLWQVPVCATHGPN